MDATSPRWRAITASEFPWEQEALDHVRALLPDRDPVQAWANFEFIADNGRVYEVDLLVVTPKGVFLVEIKSRPGSVEGDAGTWTWRNEGRVRSDDNPLILANRKAKALRSLLEHQPAVRSAHERLPWVQAMVFLSAEELTCRLSPGGAHHVYGRDNAADDAPPPGAITLPSIRDGLLTIDGETFARRGKAVDRPTSRLIARAMDQAGIRPSQRQRRVGDYEIGELLHDGPGYQDFVGTHVALKNDKCRVRIYSVPPGTDQDTRRTRERAAEREFRTLRSLSHSAILRALYFTVSDLGPAVLFEHHPNAVRLDRYLADRGDEIDLDIRLALIRQIAEAVAYAHGRHVVHRALTPSSIEIVDPDSPSPRVQVLNWQTSARDEDSTGTRLVSATRHIDRLVDDVDAAYMAPEVFGATDAAEEADVFSLGALAYLVFSGQPPARSLSELVQRLHQNHGLAIEGALDGAGAALSAMIRSATSPDVSSRTASIGEFLDDLTGVEDELTRPDEEQTVPPAVATRGDMLASDLKVARRLGHGSSAVVFEIDGAPEGRVLKVAVEPDQNERIRAEAEVLAKLHHPGVVAVYPPPIEVGDRVAIWMQSAGDKTLAERLREEGPLHLDLLERFGADLLETVEYLEREAVAHRDIKPANLGVGSRTKKDELRLTLFDFSLSRTPREAIHAGTPPYLEPFLVHRSPKRWDEHAERFAAAVTLYEMATGRLPTWGDGRSDPAALDCEVSIDQELFEPTLAPALADFFRRALAREPAERFPNGRDMRRAWEDVFTGERLAVRRSREEHVAIDSATADTALRALDLDVNVLDVLERASIYTVRDLLSTSLNNFRRKRGVGNRTRRRIAQLVMDLRAVIPDEELVTQDDGGEGQSLDAVAARLVPKRTTRNADDLAVLRALLGFERPDLGHWPSQGKVADALGRERRDVIAVLETARTRWRRSPTLRDLAGHVAAIVDTHEGVVTTHELAASLLAIRGSAVEEPERTNRALAVVRAIVELERSRGSALAERRVGEVVLLAPDREHGPEAEDVLEYVARLGAAADEIAAADPLLAPAAVLARLDQVAAPAGFEPLSDTRRVRLAAAASAGAAASSRLELYPRDMAPARALRLAQTALLGPAFLAAEDIAARVHARFPDAAPLPGRPELDQLLADAGIPYTWSASEGRYRARRAGAATASSRTSFASRLTSRDGAAGGAEADTAAQFGARLRRAIERGGFLALTVRAGRLPRAEQALAALPVEMHDIDQLLLTAMSREADRLGVKWDVVLRADAAARDSLDWQRLQQLVGRAMPAVREAILATRGVAVLHRLGLLARYGQVGLLEDLRDLVLTGHAGSLTGVWLLATAAGAGELPSIDGAPIPVLTRDQWTAIPTAWLPARDQVAA